jgi:GT2 family glycosyltransferase
MGATEKISVIILVHNHLDMTRLCLESLAKAVAHLDHEVILLDNASTKDPTSLQACGRLFKHWQFLRSEENLPFSPGNNRCATRASGRYLLFLNNDVFVAPDTVERLAGGLQDDDSAGVVGGMLLFPEGKSVQHGGMSQMLWGFPSNYGVGAHPSDQRVRQAAERFALTGAMMCLPRDLYWKVGGFDERYIWGYEDVDLCLKIRSAGRRVLYIPQATGVHVESATLKVVQNRDQPGNYRIYRETWNPILLPPERDYISKLKSQGIRSVTVFGTGLAARGLSGILSENGIQIVGFTSSETRDKGESFLGRPILPLAALREVKFDRLIVGTQFFFAVESMIRDFDPLQAPIFPVLL